MNIRKIFLVQVLIDKEWINTLAFEDMDEAHNYCKDAPLEVERKRVIGIPIATYREEE